MSSENSNSMTDPFGGDAEKQKPRENHHSLDEISAQRRGRGFGGFGGVFGNRLTVKAGEVYDPSSEHAAKWYQRLLDAGVEENGIKPVPADMRTNNQHWSLFTLFFTSMLSLLP